MAEQGYSLLVIDDQWEERSPNYRRMLEPAFDVAFVEKERSIEHEMTKAYDAVILDLILRPDWNVQSKTVLEHYLEQVNVPVFLLSGRFKTDDDIVSLLREMVIGRSTVIGLLDWNDFCAEKVYARLEVISSIQVALDKWYRREARSRIDPNEIAILHISDSQIGDSDYSFVSLGVEDHIATTLKATSHGADLIIMSGDIAYSGHPQQYTAAADWCRKLACACLKSTAGGHPQERLLLVPGNHDVDLCAASADIINFDFAAAESDAHPVKTVDKKGARQRTTCGELDPDTFPRSHIGLTAFHAFVSDVSAHSRDGNFDGSYVKSFLNWGLDVVLVSTAGLASVLDTQAVGAPYNVLERISTDIQRSTRGANPYRLLVTHHPPPEVLHADPNETARWASEAWDVFRGWVGRLNPDLWLAGHTHLGDSKILGAACGRKGLRCIVAPTLTLKQRSRGEDAFRGFTVIKLFRDGNRITGGKLEWYDLRGPGAAAIDDSKTVTFDRED